MKIRPLLLFVATLLLVAQPLHAAQAPKLDVLLGEYKKARTDVLGKLNEAYAAQADNLAKQYLAVPNLDGADRAKRFAKRLRDGEGSADGATATDTSADPLNILEANYARSRRENLANVYGFYTSTAENLRKELLRTKDQAGVDVLTTFLEKIKPDGAALIAAQATPPPPTPATPAKSSKKSSK